MWKGKVLSVLLNIISYVNNIKGNFVFVSSNPSISSLMFRALSYFECKILLSAPS